VARRRRVAWYGLAALFACLPGTLRAGSEAASGSPDRDSRFYTLHLPSAQPVAKIELSVTRASPEWEVTADYDPALCEIHCSWRRKHDEFGRAPLKSLMQPPIAAIRIFSNYVSLPAIATINPAGLGLPEAARHIPVTREPIFLSARRLFVTALARRYDSGAGSVSHTHFFSQINPAGGRVAALPLRI